MIWVLLICLAILAVLTYLLYWQEGHKPWLKDCLECLFYASFLLAGYSFLSEAVATKPVSKTSTIIGTHDVAPTSTENSPNTDSAIHKDFTWPVTGKILSKVGKHGQPAITFDLSDKTLVKASNYGEVLYAGKDPFGRGQLIRLGHHHGLETVYVHNAENIINTGDFVRQGQLIAVPRKRSKSAKSRLYFEMRRYEIAVDPVIFLSDEIARDVPPPLSSNVDTLSTCGISPGGGCGFSDQLVLPPKKGVAVIDGPTNFMWPARGRIIQKFLDKSDGINIALKEGTNIKAVEEGEVAFAGSELKGYGNMILIRHPNGYVSAYAHNNELMVTRGDKVKRGQIIAKSGQTGNVGMPQLHFELRKGSTPVNPTLYLAGI
jgi:murein DD-endopeptidase MepM/ murein hydrolase activator NlpD